MSHPPGVAGQAALGQWASLALPARSTGHGMYRNRRGGSAGGGALHAQAPGIVPLAWKLLRFEGGLTVTRPLCLNSRKSRRWRPCSQAGGRGKSLSNPLSGSASSTPPVVCCTPRGQTCRAAEGDWAGRPGALPAALAASCRPRSWAWPATSHPCGAHPVWLPSTPEGIPPWPAREACTPLPPRRGPHRAAGC